MIETIIKSDISKDIYHIFKKKEDLPIKKWNLNNNQQQNGK
jgi:hypothetical protein